MIYFGMRLRALREEKGFSQDTLAQALEVNRATISQYETSGAYPSFERLYALCQHLGVSADYLMGLSDSKQFNLAGLTDEQALAVLEIIHQYERLNAQQRRS